MLTYKILNSLEAQSEIQKQDEFISRLNPSMFNFLEIEPSVSEYLEVCKSSCGNFDLDEEIKLYTQLAHIAKKWNEMKLPSLHVNIARTNGHEMRGMCYTRGNTVYINSRAVMLMGAILGPFLAHEIFHIFSRFNPIYRNRAYSFFGFKEVDPVSPEGSVLNPDAIQNNFAIKTWTNFRYEWVIPFIQKRGRGVKYSVFNLRTKKTYSIWKTSLPYQIGITTQYIAHAEEISADFFKHLFYSVGVYNPFKIKAFKKALTREL